MLSVDPSRNIKRNLDKLPPSEPQILGPRCGKASKVRGVSRTSRTKQVDGPSSLVHPVSGIVGICAVGFLSFGAVQHYTEQIPIPELLQRCLNHVVGRRI